MFKVLQYSMVHGANGLSSIGRTHSLLLLLQTSVFQARPRFFSLYYIDAYEARLNYLMHSLAIRVISEVFKSELLVENQLTLDKN